MLEKFLCVSYILIHKAGNFLGLSHLIRFTICSLILDILKKLYLAVQIPVVSLNDDGRIVLVSKENGGLMKDNEPVNKEKIKLKLNSQLFSLTCVLHKNYILADPTSEEESIMETYLTVILDTNYQLVSLNKPGGPGLASTSAIQVNFAFLFSSRYPL